MTTRPLNIARRTTVALLTLIATACTISGCGGSGGGNGSQGATGATVLLRDTFDAHNKIESGKVNLDFSLSGSGSSSLGMPIDLKVSGPFEDLSSGKLPDFALKVSIDTGGHTLSAGAISTEGALYAELEGSAFVVPESAVEALDKSFANASKEGGEESSFSALGIEPGRWLTHPVVKGEPTIDGVQTTEIEGGLDLKELLKDTSKLSGAAGATGLGGAGGTLSPQLITGIAKAVSSAKVAVYTGNSDHLLRLLTLNADIAPKGAARAALGGLTNAKLKLSLGFEDLGEPQEIVAPKEAKPLSQLLEALEGSGLLQQSS